MNYGFLIDNTSCIGCHACSTACKSEHQVPLGVHRTWVKSVEVGRFPDVKRSFQVTRCNHCSNPPCVRICPTSAMHQRPDGIVDFDGDACIGCKACLQACPYDAIHIDPETHTAAKCNFCAHRVEVGVEPACVVVCPEHAILAGDLDDPSSEIARALGRADVTVRKPEQGTQPKLFYVGGNDLGMHPTALSRSPELFAFSDVLALHDDDALHASMPADPGRAAPGDRPAQPQGLPIDGPFAVGRSMASEVTRLAWNAQHTVPWHWPIPAYLVMKHLAGGTFLLLGILALFPALGFAPGQVVLGGALALVCTAVTLGLLIYDLDRPDRFFFLLVRPQWRSWVARAAWILTGFSAVAGVWWALETAGWIGLIAPPAGIRPVLAALSVPLGLMTSIYTAFLFAQAEGRDAWQAQHVPAQMTLHGLAFGSGVLALGGPAADGMRTVFLLALAGSLVVTLTGDLAVPQASEVARRGVLAMTRGRWGRHYWLGGVLVGHVVALLFAALGGTLGMFVALGCLSGGMFAYNLAFVMGPQEIPNS